jgi:serine/threonine-protein phosphatase PP1 catalytic subunit
MDSFTKTRINTLISKLLKYTRKDTNVEMEENDVIFIMEKVLPIIKKEPNLLRLEPSIYVCGDIHGQYGDLLQLFKLGGLPPKTTYLFLGDYVDRGDNSIEVVMLLMCYKILFPQNIYMIRGNHECETINRLYGFYDECKRRFSGNVWKKMNAVLMYLPIAAMIDQHIFCIHGGLSPKMRFIEQINTLERGRKIPDNGILCDITWSDPSSDESQTEKWAHNDRGVSYTYSASAVKEFCKNNSIDLICRAHQVVDSGYKFSYGRRLVTVFSAPNYCKSYGNSAAMLKVDNDLMCSFVILKPISSIKKKNVMLDMSIDKKMEI